jgi:hypothetical protein
VSANLVSGATLGWHSESSPNSPTPPPSRPPPQAALRGLAVVPADGPVYQTGTPNTLADLLSLHLPLLFPAPGPGAGPTLAYTLLQGVITPPEAELAWLGACMSGADGWVNICIGLGRER